MRVEWSRDKSAAKVYGDYTQYPEVFTAEALSMFDSPEAAFHQVHAWRKKVLLPRMDSQSYYPFDTQDIEFAKRNEAAGTRIWRYGTLYPTVYEYIRGFYRVEDGYAVFKNGTRVPLP